MPRPIKPIRPGNRPNLMDIVRAPLTKKMKLKSDMIRGNKKYKNNPDKKDKRDKMVKDLKKEGHSQDDIDTLAVEMYDELASMGMLEVRNVNR